MSSVEGKLSSSAGDASVTAKFSSPVKIDVRDINGDGTTEICVETKAVGATIEICVPLDPSPPVAGARGASGDDRSAGAGGSGGS